jgi:flagellar basal-body rod protein FlgG
MQSGFYQAAGAMVTQFNILDITTNNLANINTSGYKRDSVVVGSFERILKNSRDELPLENGTDEAAQFFNRTKNRVPRVVEKNIDFTASNIKQTGNKLDIALTSPDSFFALKTPQGVRLTSSSSFQLNGDGVIVNKDGYKLLPSNFNKTENDSIRVSNNSDIVISDNGVVSANGIDIGSIFVGKVKNINEIHKEGDSLYRVDNIEDRLVGISGDNLVKQGYLTMSNVNAVREMVSLIDSNRMVEIYQKVMTTHMSDLNSDAINKLASVRA